MPSIGIGLGIQNIWPGGYTAEAAAFFTALAGDGVTLTAAQKNSVNQLVLDFKAAGIWSKMHLVRPYIGGAAASHKRNLVNPSTYVATYSASGITHDANGITGDGIAGYEATGYVIQAGNQNNFHMSVYIRNNVQGNYCAVGTCTNTSSAFCQLYPRQTGAGNTMDFEINQNTTTSIANPDSRGLLLGVRRAATGADAVEVYRNGSSVLTDTDTSVTPSTAELNILARNSTGPGVRGGYSIHNIAFATAGEALTDAEAAAMYTAVQAFQTANSRNV